jgi:hypothetical protein
VWAAFARGLYRVSGDIADAGLYQIVPGRAKRYCMATVMVLELSPSTISDTLNVAAPRTLAGSSTLTWSRPG